MSASDMTDKAVILARGLGTRMRKSNSGARMTHEQEEIADTGVKALIPIERPFLDYVLTAVADAGYRRVCLVVGPEHGVLRDYYEREQRPRRVSIDFAVQVEPLGTADAVAAVEKFADGEPFLVINSDNYYPAESLRSLRELSESGLAGFEKNGMLAGSNIPPERLAKFAVVEVDDDGYMTRVIEKPDPQTLAALPDPVCLSMNCWRFGPKIFRACRSISPSQRGELELPDAVQYAIDSLGERFRVVNVSLPVLDLSSRADIAPVASKLAGVEVNL